MKSCEQYQKSISEMIDGELDAAAEQELLAHIEHCDECREMYQAFQAVSTMIVLEDVPDSLHEGVMKRVEIAVKAKKTHHKLMQFRSVFGMAACLIVVVGTVFAVRNTAKGKMNDSSSGGIEYAAESAEAPASFAAGASFAMKADSAAETFAAYDTSESEAKAVSDSIEHETFEAESNSFSLKLRILENGTSSFTGIVTDEGNQKMFHRGDEVTVFPAKTERNSKAAANHINDEMPSHGREEGKSVVNVMFGEYEIDSEQGIGKCIYADYVFDEDS